ncbi:hypothetical protein HXX76_014111 [Chlamydomonas incerta]|uniref:Uncharacterized protein n=1 Tax=Chlamydomonas incerta TaxID=51695 RepID=A0A835SK46_CHLIN|nr:hypothetical protein HXX76_014111 [Chlamydomonas incerta]|eukprot:KAG2424953.1 hypothetical protein HXX76_014111 [Chlamydomonas incerta]
MMMWEHRALSGISWDMSDPEFAETKVERFQYENEDADDFEESMRGEFVPLAEEEWTSLVHPQGMAFQLQCHFDDRADPFSQTDHQKLYEYPDGRQWGLTIMHNVSIRFELFIPARATVRDLLHMLGSLRFRCGYFEGLLFKDSTHAELRWGT